MDHNIGRLIDLIEHLGLRETALSYSVVIMVIPVGIMDFGIRVMELSTKHVLKLN